MLKNFIFKRGIPTLFWMLILAAPAAAQSQPEDVAETIRELLFQLMLIGGPVMLLVGFAMMFAGGLNPQWKQRGMEIIKWAFLGAIGIAVVQGVLWGIIEPLLSGAGGGGGT